MTNRYCTKTYVIPDLNIILKPGESVAIPIHGIQHDPEYYPEPEIFDPERFSIENKCTRHPMTFIPFGGGPRICIGDLILSLI